MADHQVTSDRIMQVGMGFWASKTLLSAVELEVFTELAKGPLDLSALVERLGLHPRSARDFLDALVALGMLQRTGERYANAPETDLFLDKAKPSYLGGILEMANARLYRFWASLTEALHEAIIDDARSQNVFGLLMSLNMLIETSGGFDFTGGDCTGWMREVGFARTRVEPLVGPDSMVVGIK